MNCYNGHDQIHQFFDDCKFLLDNSNFVPVTHAEILMQTFPFPPTPHQYWGYLIDAVKKKCNDNKKCSEQQHNQENTDVFRYPEEAVWVASEWEF